MERSDMSEFMSEPENTFPQPAEPYEGPDADFGEHDPTVGIHQDDAAIGDLMRRAYAGDEVEFTGTVEDVYAAAGLLPDGYADQPAEAAPETPLVLDVRQFDRPELLHESDLEETRRIYDGGIKAYFLPSRESRAYTDVSGMGNWNLIRTVADENGTTVLEIGTRPRVIDVTHTNVNGTRTHSMYYVDRAFSDDEAVMQRHDFSEDDPVLPAEGVLPTGQYVAMQNRLRHQAMKWSSARPTPGLDGSEPVRQPDRIVGPEEARNLLTLIDRSTPPAASVGALRALTDNRRASYRKPDSLMPGTHDMYQGATVLDDAVRETLNALDPDKPVAMYDTATRVGFLKYNDPEEGPMRILIDRWPTARGMTTLFHIRPELQPVPGEADKVLEYCASGGTYASGGWTEAFAQADTAESWRIRDILREAVRQHIAAEDPR